MKRKSSWSAGRYLAVLVGLGLISWLSFRLGESPEIEEGRLVPPEVHIGKPVVGWPSLRDFPSSPGSTASSSSPDDEPADSGAWAGVPAPRFFASSAPPVADRAAIAPIRTEESPLPRPPPETERSAWQVARRTVTPLEPLYAPGGSRIPRQAVIREGAARGEWPEPTALSRQLRELEEEPATRAWASRVLAELRQLGEAPSLSVADVHDRLDCLERLVAAGREAIRGESLEPHLASQVTRACHGMTRRLEVWRRVHQLVQEDRTWLVSVTAESLEESLNEIQKLLNSSEAAQSWHGYLLVAQLQRLAARETAHEGFDPHQRRWLGRRVLQRMTSDQLSDEQRQFLEHEPLRKLADQMRLWAYEPIDYAKFLRRIEEHEVRLVDGSAGLAEDWQSLRWSPWEETSELAGILDAHYRNANLRLTASTELINRMLPEVMVSEEDVNDQILGARVNGRSATIARLSVVLVPDDLRLRMGLVARGHVASQTRSAKGPVTFFNNGATRYRARKFLTVDGRGVRLEEAQAEASSDSRLINVATDFDGFPLVGPLVRSLAVREHNGRMPEAKAEVEFRVGSRAAQRLNEEVVRKLAEAERKYREKLVEPLHHLRLNPAIHDMQTTDQQLIVRYRLAADHQLAACTPRPAPPPASWFSMQLNESAVNNLLGQLRLEGRRQEVGEWIEELAARFQLSPPPRPEQLDQDVYVEFAAREPVHIRFDDGHVELTLRFKSLSMGRGTWHDFEVRTRFAPQVAGREISLVRDDFIEIRGAKLNFRDRLPIRGIFTALFTKQRTVPVVGAAIQHDPRLEEIEVSQCVFRDGWWGLAYGPQSNTGQQPVRYPWGDLPTSRH
jgi:hypothetical protein